VPALPNGGGPSDWMATGRMPATGAPSVSTATSAIGNA
jgi:hypothetical protein